MATEVHCRWRHLVCRPREDQIVDLSSRQVQLLRESLTKKASKSDPLIIFIQ
jgi:hypothetical protein